jgi:hypothetical protein
MHCTKCIVKVKISLVQLLLLEATKRPIGRKNAVSSMIRISRFIT